METIYKITAIHQVLQPDVAISLELTNGYGIKVTLDVNAIANNPVLMGAMPTDDRARVQQYMRMLAENPVFAKQRFHR